MPEPIAPVPLKLGIAGANVDRGWARDAHLPALRALPGIAIHAVSARTQAIADEAAVLFGATKAYADTLAMARDPDLDIIAVTVKVPEHRAIVLAALAAGKHVYCEWPLARDLAEAEELAQAARQAGVHVAIGLQGEQSLAVCHATALVQGGAVGRLLNLRVVSSTAGWGLMSPAHYVYLQDRRNGATLATIAGGHTLAAVEAVVGEYSSVSARNSILRDTMDIAETGETVERTCADHQLIIGHHAGGCVSSVEIIGGEMLPLRFELRGTAGTLEIHGDHPGGYQCADLQVTGPTAIEQPAPAIAGLTGAAINVAQLWAQFEHDIRDRSHTVPDFDRALRLHRLLDAVDRASDEKRTMEMQ